MGWIIGKWMNNVDYEKEGKIGKLIPAKRKFNPFLRALSIGTGFPDFICFKKQDKLYEVIGVEVKANGGLDKEEKEKCKWLLENKILPQQRAETLSIEDWINLTKSKFQNPNDK